MSDAYQIFIAAMAGARLSTMLMLLALLVYSLKVRPKNPDPIIKAMLVYWFVVFTNSIISNYINHGLSDVIMAVVGTPVIFVKVLGVWLSHRE